MTYGPPELKRLLDDLAARNDTDGDAEQAWGEWTVLFSDYEDVDVGMKFEVSTSASRLYLAMAADVRSAIRLAEIGLMEIQAGLVVRLYDETDALLLSLQAPSADHADGLIRAIAR